MVLSGGSGGYTGIRLCVRISARRYPLVSVICPSLVFVYVFVSLLKLVFQTVSHGSPFVMRASMRLPTHEVSYIVCVYHLWLFIHRGSLAILAYSLRCICFVSRPTLWPCVGVHAFSVPLRSGPIRFRRFPSVVYSCPLRESSLFFQQAFFPFWFAIAFVFFIVFFFFLFFLCFMSLLTLCYFCCAFWLQLWTLLSHSSIESAVSMDESQLQHEESQDDRFVSLYFSLTNSLSLSHTHTHQF